MPDTKSTYILYVEDDEGLARLLQKDLQRSGCAVDIARDGEEGLRMIDEGSYDVLLIDYKLPMYGGFDVVRKLASRGALLPTIMITGYGSEKLAVEAMKLGIADYVVKDTEMRYLELLPVVIEQGLLRQKLIVEKQQMIERVRESEERYRRLFELSTEGIFIYDEWRLEFVNPSGMRLLGASSFDDLRGRSVFDFIHPDYWQIFKDRLTEIGDEAKKVPWFEGRVRRLDGQEIYVEIMAVSFKYIDGKQAVQVIIRDVTERKLAEQRLQYLAHFDPLTGIPNRALFFDRLSQSIAQARRYDHKVALLYLDLDTLKSVNDALGHDAGDSLLKEAAHRITQCIRTSDTAARVGGDEFIVILSKIHGTEDAKVIARRIIASFRNVFYLKDREHSASVSIGISIYPRNGSDPEILMRNADTALYRAKERGGNTFQFYS